MRNLMVRAWEIAKNGANKFGGSAVDYIAEAMRMAWSEIKKGANKASKYPKAVAKRAAELLESGDQPNKQFANNKAQHEYDVMANNLSKVNAHRIAKGEKPGGIDALNKGLEKANVAQYIEMMRRINHMANNLPR